MSTRTVQKQQDFKMSKKPVVIVADSSEINLRLLEKELSDQFEVHKASTGTQASELIGKGCNAAVINVFLPEKSGLEILTELRRSDVSFPCILIVNQESEAFLRRCYALGATDVTEIPVPTGFFSGRLMMYVTRNNVKKLADHKNE